MAGDLPLTAAAASSGRGCCYLCILGHVVGTGIGQACLANKPGRAINETTVGRRVRCLLILEPREPSQHRNTAEPNLITNLHPAREHPCMAINPVALDVKMPSEAPRVK